MTSVEPTEAQRVAPRRGARPLVIGGAVSVVLFAAFAFVLWFGIAYHLIGFSAEY